jgi:hypothetical protein
MVGKSMPAVRKHRYPADSSPHGARIPSGDPDRRAGTFAPGHPGAKARGTHNKITRDLKTGIVDAAVNHGKDGSGEGGLTGYLEFIAAKHPKAFVALLGRLMPLQITGNAGTFIGSVNIVSVPQDRYLSADDIAALVPERPRLELEPLELEAESEAA